MSARQLIRAAAPGFLSRQALRSGLRAAMPELIGAGGGGVAYQAATGGDLLTGALYGSIVGAVGLHALRPNVIMRRLTRRAYKRGLADPAAVEAMRAAPNPRMGRYVEDQVQTMIKNSSVYSRLFRWTGKTRNKGRFVSSVDFVGRGSFRGMRFDITSMDQLRQGRKWNQYGADLHVVPYGPTPATDQWTIFAFLEATGAY